MNQTNIPPVNQANRPLVSVGNGNQVKWGDFPVTQQVAGTIGTITTLNGDVTGSATSNQVVSFQGQTLAISGANFPGNGSLMQYSTATSSWTTVSAPTVVGQILEWNGGAWVQNATTTPANGNTLVWNSSTSKWTPGNITLAGDVTGSSASNTVVKLQNYPVNITGLTTSGQMLFWTNLGGTGQWVTTYVPTGTGSMLFWNGTSWESTSTTSIATGNTLIWNGSTSKWAPGNITLAGDVTGSTSANSVIKLQNYPVNVTSIAHGEMLWWSNVSGYQQFTTGPQPTTTGQYYSWDTNLFGTGISGWNLSSAGGGITNDAQPGSNGSGTVTTASGVNPANLPSAVFTTAMSGFSKYQITASISIRSTSATTAYMQIHNGTSLVGIPMAATLSANAVANITNTTVVSASPGTSYSFYIFASVQGGTGSHAGAVITAIGIN